ncbi:putative YigZ family protein [Arthrobacter sp. CAN_A6]|uniref:IMPACT family protein n=1 Tax=Arthrobacter sp. CAN_A6 TaxID=2787721 RepID=UPI0018CBDA3E
MTASAGTATSYSTVSGESRHELEVKRSRFIAVLDRVESEEQAREHLLAVRREFSSARHHCSAYLVGAGRHVQRSYDDGEPVGTAGAPILEALSRTTGPTGVADFSDVGAVVVRYFGGILLGAGGLVRAYSEAAAHALRNARPVRRELLALFRVDVPVVAAGRLENELRSAGFSILGTGYGFDAARIEVALPFGAAAAYDLESRVAAATLGTAAVTAVGEQWVDR